MINWRELTKDEQIAALQNVAGAKHIPPQAVEKDLWVTTILQIVFSLPFADSLVFKGGTSLSKVFGKIERFSEDIDLAIDRTYFGLEGDLTKKQLKKLRKEPRKIFIEYPSLFRESLDYIKPRVMLETGARSLIEPTTSVQVKSLVETAFPDVCTASVNPFIPTAVIEKTFLEKVFLLHELFTTNAGWHANRKSRHLYDLEKMMDEPFAEPTIHNDELWESISHHRQVFTSMRDVDYTPDVRKRIVLVPPADFMKEWRDDYEAMRSTMVFGPSLAFNALIERLHLLEERFHQ